MQIDFINVLAPAHYLAPFSRLGPYDRKLLDGVVYGRHGFTEQWAHEASIVPVESWPLLRHRMENHRVRPWGFETFLERNPDYVEWVLGEVRDRGPLSADDLPEREGVSRRLKGAWIGTVPRAVLEALFGRGVLAVAGRRPNFARVFDLAERVVPAEHLDRRVSREGAQRELLRMAARSCGVGTAADLLGDRLVARVDVKADRLGRRLLVPAAYAEQGVNRGEAARALASELRTMAEWLGLESVAVGRRGDLARELGAAAK